MGRQKTLHLNTTKQGDAFLSAVVEHAEYNEIVIQHVASGEGESALWTLEKIDGKKVPVKFPNEDTIQNIVNLETERAMSAETMLAEAIESITIEGIEIVQLDKSELTANEQAAYVLKVDGEQKGARISIPKDNALYRAYLGHVDDTLVSPYEPTVIDGTGDTALCFIYQLSDGKYTLVTINISEFIEETEFADGLVVSNHIVKVLIDPASESYLTVSESGIKLEGIDNELNDFNSKLNDEIDRAFSAETMLAEAIEAETERAMSAETVLQEEIDSIELVKIDDPSELSINEREAYLLKVDNVTKGARVSIYKDSSLYMTYLGHVDDLLESEDSPVVIDGSGDEALCFIYYTMEGKYQLVTINVEKFLSENEFLDGLVVFQNHSIKVKIDPTSEKYNGVDLLTVSREGVKLNGVQNIVTGIVQTTIDNLVIDCGTY